MGHFGRRKNTVAVVSIEVFVSRKAFEFFSSCRSYSETDFSASDKTYLDAVEISEGATSTNVTRTPRLLGIVLLYIFVLKID